MVALALGAILYYSEVFTPMGVIKDNARILLEFPAFGVLIITETSGEVKVSFHVGKFNT